jgi:hypothetical protein
LTTTTEAPARVRPDRRLRLAGVAAAIVLAALAWVVAVPVLGADMIVEDASGKEMEIGIAPVLIMTTIWSLLGWAFLEILERFTRHARLIWTIVAGIVLLVTFAPLAGPMSGGTRATLAVLHLAVGAPLIAAFYRSAPPR